MDAVLEKKLMDAVWAANSLFARGKTSGSSANLSFMHEGKIYITASGTCFGTLTPDDFAIVSLEGECLNGKKASRSFLFIDITMRASPRWRLLSIRTAHMPCSGLAGSLKKARILYRITRPISK